MWKFLACLMLSLFSPLSALGEEQKSLLPELAAAGFSAGQVVWTRVPMHNKDSDPRQEPLLAGLTQVEIVDAFEGREYGRTWRYLTVRLSNGDMARLILPGHRPVDQLLGTKHPKTFGWSKRTLDSIAKRRFFFGMTQMQFISVMGYPDEVHESGDRNGAYEQWVYKRYSADDYFYFRNGRYEAYN